MAWPTLDSDSFIGAFDIDQSSLDTSLSNVIRQYYADFARQIVGAAAYKTIADLGDPLPDKYDALLNGATYKPIQSEREQKHHQGVMEAVKRALYFKYAGMYNKSSTEGLVKNEVATANMASATSTAVKVTAVWNEAAYITVDVLDFVEAFTKRKYEITSITGAGPYTVAVPDTTYLQDGDTVSISDTDYTVSNLVPDTSFSISAGMPPSAEHFIFTAFPNYEDYQEYAYII